MTVPVILDPTKVGAYPHQDPSFKTLSPSEVRMTVSVILAPTKVGAYPHLPATGAATPTSALSLSA